jgi:mitogen-activated protein kinase kinase kinase
MDYTWAPRPPPEDVYDHLEEFFPNHDLDKPVIEASSGGTSPTTADYAPIPLAQINQPDKSRVRGKKSIRIVAEEHKKRIDRNSRADLSSVTSVLRKRSTKLWGSRLEEVTTAQARTGFATSLPDSPSGAKRKSSYRGNHCANLFIASYLQVGPW